jgi:hypothetical protein
MQYSQKQSCGTDQANHNRENLRRLEPVPRFQPDPDTQVHVGHQRYATGVDRYRQRYQRQTPSPIFQRLDPPFGPTPC